MTTTKKDILDIYPLSPMQKGMLFHTLLAPQAGIYVPQVTFSVVGELDSDRFRQAWEKAVSACSVLRTSFHWEKRDQPFQVVRQQVNLPWVEQDWRLLSEAEKKEKLQVFLECDRSLGFDLKTPPLIRLALIQWGTQHYQFIFSYHHLILDGWSVGNLLRGVFAWYFHSQDFKIRPYSDYIAWLNQQNQEAAAQFWQNYLKGFVEPTALPLEKTQEVTSTENFGEENRQFSAASLKTFAQQYQLTLATIAQGAFALLLSRYTNTSDIVFGSTSAGRPSEVQGSESMIGLFINTLPVRVQLNPKITVVSWLEHLQRDRATALAPKCSSLLEIQSWSDLPTGTPLFNSLLVFENYPVETPTSSALHFENLQFNEWTNFPLTLLVSAGEEVSLKLKYDRDRLSSQSAQQLLSHLQRLLMEITKHPTGSLHEIEMLSTEEQQQFERWNQTTRDYPLECCLPAAFETQVLKTPDAIAVIFDALGEQLPITNNKHQLTYRELNDRANTLADYFQSLGVCPETRIAVYLQRSIAMVVALLGILKAGGTYVPLDRDYPVDRLSWMLQDVDASVLLTDRAQNLAPLSVPDSIQVLDFSQLPMDRRSNQETFHGTSLHPDNSIYIIYTSGSTGRPKGVINTHRAVMNRLYWMQEAYNLNERDRVLQKTSFGFDVSVWEFFWPLLNGAQLVLGKPDGHRDPSYLAQLIEQAEITTLHFVPSLLSAFLEVPALREKCRSLKRVICSGEALSTQLQQKFFETLDAQLYNLYGPTEAAIDVTAYHCQPVEEKGVSVAIGSPIANTQIYLLDRDNRQVPLGCAGELCIGGVGVARGYWNRPELTAEKFIPNPFAEGTGNRERSPLTSSLKLRLTKGGTNNKQQITNNKQQITNNKQQITNNKQQITNNKLYKTGDLARYRCDGTLEYLGRLDQQVKIRGVRIELGEVEAVLNQHPEVQQSVAIVRKDTATADAEPQLVAYVVLEGNGEQITNNNFKEFLKTRLPEAMIPQAFVTLSSLPLTANGKLDRRSLPAPKLEFGGVPPSNETEIAIAQIWQEVLKLDRNQHQIGIHDNFFELGGNSLSAVRVNTRLQVEFDLEFPLRMMFERPTIAELAQRVDAMRMGRQLSPQTPQNQRKEIEL